MIVNSESSAVPICLAFSKTFQISDLCTKYWKLELEIKHREKENEIIMSVDMSHSARHSRVLLVVITNPPLQLLILTRHKLLADIIESILK